MEAFPEAAEFRIERHEIYYTGICAKRTEGWGTMLKIPSRIRACFSMDSFFRCFIRVVRTPSVRCMPTFNPLESNGIKSLAVGCLGELVRI